MAITHSFVCAIADDATAAANGEVVPTNWNADHAVTNLVLTHGTITTDVNTLGATVTWNAAGVTFTGIKLNVTNTASAAGSLLADWQVGGVSKASITVGGRVASGATWAAGQAQFYNSAAGPGAGLSISASGEDVDLVANGICVLTVDAAQGYRLHGNYPFGFVNGHARNNVSDVRLWRDAAATLALRNSTTAQTFRVYGTYTDSSNYVRASLSSSSTAITLAAETAGTGADNIDINLTPAGAGSVVISNGTVTADAPLLDLAQTWNAGGVTFTGINFAFTATAAAGGSKALVISETSTYGTIFSIDRYGGFFNYGSLYSSNRFSVGYAAEIIHIKSTIPIGWGTGDPNTGTLDTALFRDAAATLALRNGTNAQTFRVYGTYTDSSNYVRASLSSSSTAVTLAAETAGTGADNVPVNITPSGTEGVQIGNFAQLTEMTAPAAGASNTARIFAEDNGSGKTRLMVQFASGAAVQLAIEP